MKKHSSKFVKIVNDAKNNIKEISFDQLDSLKNYILIDVREDHEWEKGHIPGAIHLSKGIIERDIESKIPNTNQPLVLYCGGGFRSALACENLNKMGYTQIYSLIGGYREWKSMNK